jgi:hypothetical protein
MILAAVVADRVRRDQQAEDDAAAGEAAQEPAPDAVGLALGLAVLVLAHLVRSFAVVT